MQCRLESNMFIAGVGVFYSFRRRQHNLNLQYMFLKGSERRGKGFEFLNNKSNMFKVQKCEIIGNGHEKQVVMMIPITLS